MNDYEHEDPFVRYHKEQEHHSDVNRNILYISMLSFLTVLFLFIAFYLYCRWIFTRRSHHRAAIHRLTLAAMHVSDVNTGTTHSQVEPANAGLDPAIIASLPTFTVGAKVLEGGDGGGGATSTVVVECAVCLSALEGEEKAKLLPNCNHFFHVGCIETWLNSHATCPLCRAEVKPQLKPENREGPITLTPASRVFDLDGGESSKDNDSSSRLSPFRRMLSRGRSSTRVLPTGRDDEHADSDPAKDLERQ
ncbi:hypothetical protein VNO78_06167 [Psophocarpus tetragonolobus]|uniref:RING-type E3 ubiquitin transferase n=1 Tax=Psophocarpus tetragonolobus TaxID=3891 RepID=A0AAN9SRY7_PSOTE